MRRRGRWWRVLVPVAVVPALAGCREQPHESAEPLESVESSSTAAAANEMDALRAQLAENPTVIMEMVFRKQPRGTMLCGLRELGRDGDRLYAWILCEDFRTGPGARALSGTSEPAVLTVSGHGSDIRLKAAEFPRQATVDADIDRMFPPGIAQVIRRGDFTTIPDEDGLLAEARALQ